MAAEVNCRRCGQPIFELATEKGGWVELERGRGRYAIQLAIDVGSAVALLVKHATNYRRHKCPERRRRRCLVIA